MDSRVLIAVIIAIAAIAIVGLVLYSSRYKSKRLKQHYGAEYERVVQQQGDPRRAENVLIERERRVEKFKIHSLAPADRDRYLQEWAGVQRRFVDDPQHAVLEAETLVTQVMTARGYPMGNFDESAEAISVHYPLVVENYRVAHEIANRHSMGQSSTEDLRRAMVHYRTLFEELLEQPHTGQREVA